MTPLNLIQIPGRIWAAFYANQAPFQWQVLSEFQATGPSGKLKKLCIFAHYDPQGVIDPYVVQYLESLNRLGCEILFLSSGPVLADAEATKISAICMKIIHRMNIGLDFGAWKLGLELLGREKVGGYDQLVLANDSVYGPFQALDGVFSEMEKRNLDLWGMTDCKEIAPHLQSYFLVFEKRILRSGFFKEFWSTFKYLWRKRQIISDYEVGLSLRAEQSSFKTGSFISSEKVGIGDLNSTLFAWEKLISEFKFPFLKIEILKLNRFKSKSVKDWKKIIEKVSDYDTRLILNHLKRVAPAKASEHEVETRS